MRSLVLLAITVALASPLDAGARPRSQERGTVVLDNFSSRAKVPPVRFAHWRHRARYTCRACHVDVGFAMQARATRVSARTNRDGYHCGACHDGKTSVPGVGELFAACSDAPFPASSEDGACGRCHARGDAGADAKAFDAFARQLPRSPAGEVDWMAAEEQGLIAPSDFVKGASMARERLTMDRDVAIELKRANGIIFSHVKHAVWNGCEVCHPDIYPRTSRGSLRQSMKKILAGESCGVCHDKVAFALGDCDRCHTTRPEGF